MAARIHYDTELVQIFFGIYIILYVILVAIGSAWFWRRRELHPISKRVPFVVLVSNAVNVAFCVILTVEAMVLGYWPCHSTLWHTITADGIVGVCYLVRCWVLIFHTELAREQIAREHSDSLSQSPVGAVQNVPAASTRTLTASSSADASPPVRPAGRLPTSSNASAGDGLPIRPSLSGNSTEALPQLASAEPLNPGSQRSNGATAPGQVQVVISPASPRSIRQDSLLDGFEADPEKYDARTFYMANKGLVAPMYLFKVSLILVLIQVFPAVVLSISRAPTRGASGFCEDEPTRYYIVVQLVILASAFALMAIRLRGIDDGLFIKRELRLTAFAAVMGGLLWVLTQGVWLHETSGTFPTHMLVAVLAYAAVFSISTLWPLWASYQTAPAVQSGEIITLRKLLAHSEGRQAFLGHLQSEFSVENLVFWEGVERFRQEATFLEGTLHSRLSNADEMPAVGVPSGDKDRAKSQGRARTLSMVATSQRRVRRKALALYNRCIKDGAPFEICLPYDVKCEFDLLFKPTGGLTAAALEKRENKKGLELQKRQLAKDLKNVEYDDAGREPSESRPSNVGSGKSSLGRKRAKERERLHEDWGAPGDAPPENGVDAPHGKHRREDSRNSNASSDHDDEAADDPVSERTPVDHMLYDQAQRIIFEEMLRDSYPRFLATSEYRSLAAQMNSASALSTVTSTGSRAGMPGTVPRFDSKADLLRIQEEA